MIDNGRYYELISNKKQDGFVYQLFLRKKGHEALWNPMMIKNDHRRIIFGVSPTIAERGSPLLLTLVLNHELLTSTVMQSLVIDPSFLVMIHDDPITYEPLMIDQPLCCWSNCCWFSLHHESPHWSTHHEAPPSAAKRHDLVEAFAFQPMEDHIHQLRLQLLHVFLHIDGDLVLNLGSTAAFWLVCGWTGWQWPVHGIKDGQQ